MKINCHIDPNLDEEHGELWIKEMTPTKSPTIHFDRDILNLIHKQANLATKTRKWS